MQDYSVAEAAHILGLSDSQVRRLVREGFLDAHRSWIACIAADGEGNLDASQEPSSEGTGSQRPELRLGFQDLVLLRTAKDLVAERVSPGRIRKALLALRSRLPNEAPLSGVRFMRRGDELVVRDADGVWSPDSGQTLFDFVGPEDVVAPVSALEGAMYREGVSSPDEATEEASSETFRPDHLLDPAEPAEEMRCADWMDLAEAFEAGRRLTRARDALRRALECDPFETEARRRLGRLLERDGLWERAEAHYRLARTQRPDDSELVVAHGRTLVQMGQTSAALDAFETARALDPSCLDALYGAAEVYERMGNGSAAERMLAEAAALGGTEGKTPPIHPRRS